MIRYMLCLLMMMMVVVNTVVGAPGLDDMPQNKFLIDREDKQRPSASGTLDRLGGGNILRVDTPDLAIPNFRSLELLVNYQDDMPQNMVLIAREDKQRPSASGTLDPLGGGHLLKIEDSDADTEIFRSLKSLFASQENIPQNTDLLAREDKQKSSSSGIVDSLGGGNLVRIVDPDAETEFLNSLELLTKMNQGDISENEVFLAREDKQKPSSSGTLDPIGGGNLVRIVDSDAVAAFSSSLDLLIENQGRQNMMRLAREDKSEPHTVDKIGGGILGLVDPYKVQVFRSLDRSHLADSLDQGGDVQRMFDSISASELLSSLDSADRMAVLSALRKTHSKYNNKRMMLDSVSGWGFGESKRNFDEIDNVGFTGFAKRSPYPPRQHLALAKKNFDEIDRAGFETYNKRDFDEIDRAGFETFEKRNRKD